MIPSGPHILVVDREYLVAMEAERLLSDALSCSVRIAMPHDYLAALAETHFDVVLIDAGMVNANGVEALQLAQKRGAGLVFTTLTNDAMDNLPRFQGSAKVAKPFNDADLLAAVQSALAMLEPDI